MRKVFYSVTILLLVAAVLYLGSVAADRKQLDSSVLRLHVVGASDSEADQAVKLKVRDAVLSALPESVLKAEDKTQAVTSLTEKLNLLEDAANSALDAAGVEDRATVTLLREEFPIRYYDTFTLPSGVYDSLRVTIGNGEGRNWWCVVFPNLCISAASGTVADTAVSAGFSDTLAGSITGQSGYEVRFFFLDYLGKLQNFFHKG